MNELHFDVLWRQHGISSSLGKETLASLMKGQNPAKIASGLAQVSERGILFSLIEQESDHLGVGFGNDDPKADQSFRTGRQGANAFHTPHVLDVDCPQAVNRYDADIRIEHVSNASTILLSQAIDLARVVAAVKKLMGKFASILLTLLPKRSPCAYNAIALVMVT